MSRIIRCDAEHVFDARRAVVLRGEGAEGGRIVVGQGFGEVRGQTFSAMKRKQLLLLCWL